MFADGLRLLLALALVSGAGIVVLYSVAGRGLRLGLALGFALAVALGVGWVGIALFLASLAGLDAGWPWIGPGSALVLLPVAWWRGRASPRSSPPLPATASGPEPRAAFRAVHAALVAVAALGFASAAALACARPLWEWDALSIWMLKAKSFAAFESVRPYYADLELGIAQPHYPPLVSLAAAFTWSVLGHLDERWVRGFFALIYAALLAGVAGLGRRRGAPAAGALAAALLAIVPCFSYREYFHGPSAAAALADVPLALYTLLAVGLAAEWRADRRAAWLALSALCAGLALWTKQEGALVPLCAAAAVAWRGGSLASALRLGVVAGAVFLPWYLYQRGVPVTDEEYHPEVFTVATFVENAERVPVVLRRIGGELLDVGAWGLLWPLALAALCLAPRRAVRSGALLLALAALAHLAAYAAVYVVDDHMGRGAYELKMNVSLTRLLMHVAPLAALLVAWQWKATRCPARGGSP